MKDHEQPKEIQKPKGVFPMLQSYKPPDTAKDPMSMLMAIIENEKIGPEDKTQLIRYATNRFTNRRKMAYLSLAAILISLVFLLFGAVFDAVSPCVADNSCTGILTSVNQSSTLFIWIEGFFAAIVATYYGLSSFRPST